MMLKSVITQMLASCECVKYDDMIGFKNSTLMTPKKREDNHSYPMYELLDAIEI